MEMDPSQEEGPKLNPELERRAKLPSLAKIRVWLSKKEESSASQRLVEGVTCGVVAGVILWLLR
jgi:hypothetical protein